MPVSHFVHALRCGTCGTVSPADASTDMLTHIETDVWRGVYRVGDDLALDWRSIAPWYLVLREPEAGEPVRLLEAWQCEACGARNWAEIVIRDGVVESITESRLSSEALDRVHALDDRVVDDYLALTGEQLFVDGAPRPGWAERLRAALSASGSATRPLPADPPS